MSDNKYHFILSTARDNMYDRQLIDGVADFARTTSTCRFSFVNPGQLDAALAANPPDGVICRVFRSTRPSLLEKLQLPTVDLIDDSDWKDKSAVLADDARIGRLAAEHFLERRFRSFAFFGYRSIGYSERRRDAFLARLAEDGLTAHVFERETQHPKAKRHEMPSYRNMPLLDKPLLRWLNALPKQTAAFCCHDPLAVNVLEACHASGVAVPNEIAILGVDDDTVCCDFTLPRLSSINPNSHAIGFAAARRLLDLAQHPAARRRHEVQTIPPLGVTARESSEVYPLTPEWLSDALVYIRRNATKGISACDVFAQLGLSHTRVQDAFREQLGTTVQREIVTVRMEEARRLLRNTQLPVSEIAAQCGFASLHYFSQSFTATQGMSPQSWRNLRQTENVTSTGPSSSPSTRP